MAFDRNGVDLAPRGRADTSTARGAMLAPALTILLSSFLLFLVQPILAKQILPWFGGSAGVWTTCLVFFQVTLVLGYAYAHLLTRRGIGSRQFVVHIVLVLTSLATLPIIAGPFWKEVHGIAPALRILSLLTLTVGLPYFLLAATGPLLQKWLSTAASSPLPDASVFRLFALSNLGSLLGLLSYPFLLEPALPLRTQALAWSCGYVLFAAAAIGYTYKRRQLPSRDGPDLSRDPQAVGHPALRLVCFWVACAALGSALLLSATNQITQNVAAVPLLWIVPLSLYLFSFTVCFEGHHGRGWYVRSRWVSAAMLATGAMAWALFADRGNLSVHVALPVFMAGVFFGCVLCHGELARTKPAPEFLTHFYLSIAVGGAFGGLLVGLVAPLMLAGYWEMPLAVIALAILGLYCTCEEARLKLRTSWITNVVLALISTAFILLLLGGLPSALDPYTLEWTKIVQGDARWGCAALLILSALLFQRYHAWRAVALGALFCSLSFSWESYRTVQANTRYATRNFYGTLRVSESAFGARVVRQLTHGTIMHGAQVMQLPQRAIATTYYGASSGIGRTISFAEQNNPSIRVGSVGLGVGTLTAYGRSTDSFRIYELNPAVLDIAETQFDYLKDSKAQIDRVLGDARLSLERELNEGRFDQVDQRFDVLSLDAFSGDAIPIHLLTEEAFATYARVLKPNGVIAFHLSNRYLNLPPVVAQIAHRAGFDAILIADRPAAWLMNPSDWVLVTRNPALLRFLESTAVRTRIAARENLPVWTDQFTNLVQILK
jgi:SAM-dependent methyltransferase